MSDQDFLQQAIQLAKDNVEQGGRPFGAVIVQNGEVVSTSVNQILTTGDPISHAELNALRAAAQSFKDVFGCNAYVWDFDSFLCVFKCRCRTLWLIYSTDCGEITSRPTFTR